MLKNSQCCNINCWLQWSPKDLGSSDQRTTHYLAFMKEAFTQV